MSILKTIDIFGNSFKLNVNGSETFNTLLGGVFSLLVFCTTLILTWYFGQDIYLKENPKYLTKTAYTDTTPMITVNSSSFYYAIRIEYENGTEFNNPRYFQLSFQYEYFYSDAETGVETLIKQTNLKST